MSKTKRREFSPAFKAKVCLEVIKEETSIGELAARYEVHPTVIRAWKKEFLERASEIFVDKRKQKKSEKPVTEEMLYKQIGQMKVENDWLKKTLGVLEKM